MILLSILLVTGAGTKYQPKQLQRRTCFCKYFEGTVLSLGRLGCDNRWTVDHGASSQGSRSRGRRIPELSWLSPFSLLHPGPSPQNGALHVQGGFPPSMNTLTDTSKGVPL